MNKLTIFILLAVSIVITCASCRKTYNCPKAGLACYYINYDTSEIDSLIVYRYEKGTNFTVFVDSINLFDAIYLSQVSNDTFRVSIPNIKENEQRVNEYIEYDVEIKNIFNNQSNLIKDIVYDNSTYSISNLSLGRTTKCQSEITQINLNGLVLNDGAVYDIQ